MKSIRIQNLRSLEDTQYVELKPITILVGQNSSGKSTFLRTFPLLRQSVETRISGPVLWNGTYVDFGDFDTAVCKMFPHRSIGFGFQVQINKKVLRSGGLLSHIYPVFGIKAEDALRSTMRGDLLEITPIDTTLEIKIVRDSSGNSYVNKIQLSFYDHNVEISISGEGNIDEYLINSTNLTNLLSSFQALDRGGLIPRIVQKPTEGASPFQSENKIQVELLKTVRQSIGHNKLSKTQLQKIMSTWRIGSTCEILQIIKSSGDFLPAWYQEVSTWSSDNTAFLKIRDLWLALAALHILGLLGDYYRNYYSSLKYVAPVRATAERYYRVQNLAIDEPDFQGQNLPMYLRNLSDSERTSLNDWTNKLFDFSIKTESMFGHTSLFVTDAQTKEKSNLADTGFGYSQILPILVQLWALTGRRNSRRYQVPILVAIEQPELHLHPRMQARLADAFVKVVQEAKERKIDITLLIETHSSTMVNRLGHLVMKKNLDPKDVNVVLFDKENYVSPTQVSFSHYDEEGFLENWPYGFFEPEDE